MPVLGNPDTHKGLIGLLIETVILENSLVIDLKTKQTLAIQSNNYIVGQFHPREMKMQYQLLVAAFIITSKKENIKCPLMNKLLIESYFNICYFGCFFFFFGFQIFYLFVAYNLDVFFLDLLTWLMFSIHWDFSKIDISMHVQKI